MVLAEPGGRVGGVLPGGAGAGIAGHQGRGNTKGEQALCRGPFIAGDIGRYRLAVAKPASGSLGRRGGDGRTTAHQHGNGLGPVRRCGGGHLGHQPTAEQGCGQGAVDDTEGEGCKQGHGRESQAWELPPPSQDQSESADQGQQQAGGEEQGEQGLAQLKPGQR